MSKVFLVRHAETDWNRERRIQGGGSDTPLNALGREQAACLAARLAHEDLAAVYASPLLRAKVTAEVIAGERLPLILAPSLREVEAGDLEGRAIAEMGGSFSKLLTAEKDGHARMPGGETLKEVQDRAWAAVLGGLAAYPGRDLVLVTHYFVILALVCRVLELSLERIILMRLNTGSLSAIEFGDGRPPRLILFNESCFQTGSLPL